MPPTDGGGRLGFRLADDPGLDHSAPRLVPYDPDSAIAPEYHFPTLRVAKRGEGFSRPPYGPRQNPVYSHLFGRVMGKSLVEHFAVIEDPRRGLVTHNLVEMLEIVTCALFSEVETFVEMAEWARYKEAWLQGFLRLEHGLPSHDRLNWVFRLLDPKSFEAMFRAWVAYTPPAFGGQIAIDGKSLRGAWSANPIHLVSAFATEMGLVLAQEEVADSGGETAAIPDLLRALALRGCPVSLDALGCQRDIAWVIRERDADFLHAVNGNQPSLRQALEDAFADSPEAPAHEYLLSGHGRRSAQLAQGISNTGQVDNALWPNCQSLGRGLSIRSEAGKPGQIEVRYYISSARLDPDAPALAVRRHWAIENDLHGRLEVTLAEDACTVRRDTAPQNLSILRRLILNLLNQDIAHPKRRLRLRRKVKGWDDYERT